MGEDLSRRKKRSVIDELFKGAVFDETEKLFGKASGTGYSISVVQTPEGTKVRAKVGKDTDTDALEKQLKQQYPNAEIKIEGGKTKPLIREISTKNLEQEDQGEESTESK